MSPTIRPLVRSPNRSAGLGWPAWKVLVVLATVYLVLGLAFSIHTLLSLPDSQGHAGGFAALAAVLFAGVVLISYAIGLVIAWLLKRRIAVPIVTALLVLGSGFVYVMSGLFEGFLPMVLIGLIVGILAILEEYGSPIHT